jgi:hypothetical protein
MIALFESAFTLQGALIVVQAIATEMPWFETFSRFAGSPAF